MRRVLCETQANIRIQNNIHRRQVKQDTALFLRVKYNAILEALKDVCTPHRHHHHTVTRYVLYTDTGLCIHG